VIESGSTYVALGSSFAAGPGIRPVEHAGAQRSGRNYAHQLARRLSLRLVDATVSGATTANLLTRPQRTLTGRLAPQFRAVTPGAALVTISVGGNDLGYIGTLTSASLVAALRRSRFVPAKLRNRLEGLPADFGVDADDLDELTQSLVDVVAVVRARAPGARVVLVDYLTVLGPDARPGRRIPLDIAEIADARAMADALAKAFADAAADSAAELVRVSAASEAHGVGSAEPWVSGFELGPPIIGTYPYHPNLDGMSAVAGLLAEHLLSS
jgi:lysophospholipase L1-like esterase